MDKETSGTADPTATEKAPGLEGESLQVTTDAAPRRQEPEDIMAKGVYTVIPLVGTS
ncbi:MAG TPA: hypothetical protein VIT01_07180 [Acidimicrobiales bacterium]